jgi:hypothetical protein
MFQAELCDMESVVLACPGRVRSKCQQGTVRSSKKRQLGTSQAKHASIHCHACYGCGRCSRWYVMTGGLEMSNTIQFELKQFQICMFHCNVGLCGWCGSKLLKQEVFSLAKNKLVTPCCANGRLYEVVHLPETPDAFEELMEDRDFTELERKLNHASKWVTTLVLPKPDSGGRGFHFPKEVPCLLNLHGVVSHFMRAVRQPASHGDDDDAPLLADINNSITQWWVTPEQPGVGDAKLDSMASTFQSILASSNPVTVGLRRACELQREGGGVKHIIMQFQYGDTGPDVSAVYHTPDPDNKPPKLMHLVWPRGTPEKEAKSRTVRQGEVDALTFPVLFPTGKGAYNPKAMCKSGKRVTRCMWTRYILCHTHSIPQFARCQRSVQEWVLHCWNEIEVDRLSFYRNTARELSAVREEDLANDPNTPGRPSHIPASFMGGQ